MRFIQQWRSRVFAFTIIGALYILSYGYVRSQHLLVHYSTSAAGNTNSHRIMGGDFGLGFNPAYQIAGISYWAFTPLRQIETGFWYLRYPVGQPWPYEVKTSRKLAMPTTGCLKTLPTAYCLPPNASFKPPSKQDEPLIRVLPSLTQF